MRACLAEIELDPEAKVRLLAEDSVLAGRSLEVFFPVKRLVTVGAWDEVWIAAAAAAEGAGGASPSDRLALFEGV